MNASERHSLDNITSRVSTNIQHDKETNTTTEKDYLLTLNPLQYSVLFKLKQKLDSRRFLVHVNAVERSLSKALFVIVVENRSVLFYSNNSIFGLFKLANISSWQKLVVSFNHREISVTQECAEFSYLTLPSEPILEEWEKITVTAQTDDSKDDIQV